MTENNVTGTIDIKVRRVTPAVLFAIGMVGCMVDACAPECATRASTRCRGDEAQVCTADQHWQSFEVCTDLGLGWVCAELPSGAACLRDTELDGGAFDGAFDGDSAAMNDGAAEGGGR